MCVLMENVDLFFELHRNMFDVSLLPVFVHSRKKRHEKTIKSMGTFSFKYNQFEVEKKNDERKYNRNKQKHKH